MVLPELSRVVVQDSEPAPAEPESEGLTVVREAHRTARAIIARAKARARELEAEARELGFRAGREQAFQAESLALCQAAHALRDGVVQIITAASEAERDLTETLPRLAFGLARAILGTELVVNPEALSAVVRTAVRAVLPARQVRIGLHPDDLALLERSKSRLGDLLEGSELKLESREALERGHVSVETEGLILDTSLERQLHEAMRLLQEPL
jgi:flagellar biosynthesis/type III secretory pathway protein FliH